MHYIKSSALLAIALASYSFAAPLDESINNKLSKRLEDGQYNANSGGTYNGDEGTYITSDSVHRYASGVKCWTDYMLVSQEKSSDGYKDASGPINCASTSECSSETASGVETCESWSTSLNAGVEGEIFSFGVQAGYELQKCHTASGARTCTWDDGGCHRVTTAQEVVVQKGYQRRRCDDGGDYTAWLKDFEHRVPTEYAALSCDNTC
ncbi:hypothetical protein Q7P35_011134 [Cladosporium inversicolor]